MSALVAGMMTVITRVIDGYLSHPTWGLLPQTMSTEGWVTLLQDSSLGG